MCIYFFRAVIFWIRIFSRFGLFCSWSWRRLRDFREVESDPRRVDAFRGAGQIRCCELRLVHLQIGDAEIIERLPAFRSLLERLLEDVDRLARSSEEEEPGSVIQRPFDRGPLHARSRTERLEGHLGTA